MDTRQLCVLGVWLLWTIESRSRSHYLLDGWFLFLFIWLCGQLEHCAHCRRILSNIPPILTVADGLESLLDCESSGLSPGPRWLQRSPRWRLPSLGSWTFLCGPAPQTGRHSGAGSSEGFWFILSRTSVDHSNHTNYSRGNNRSDLSIRKIKLKVHLDVFRLFYSEF